jgi:hypothetical protein
MNKRVSKINLVKYGIIITAIAVILFTLNAVYADQYSATYTGTETCTSTPCHEGIFNGWNDTFHGIDFTVWDYHGSPTNKYTYAGGGCISCHVIGYNQTSIGGYDPAYAWNSTENEDLLGIGCEDCHGPGTEHLSSYLASDMNQVIDPLAGSCGGTVDAGCHAGARQYGNETIDGWSASAHSTGVAGYAQRLACSHCMSTEGFIATAEGNPLTSLPDDVTWKQTCGACHDLHPDPGQTTYEAQLRLPAEEICGTCHRSTSEFGSESIHHPTNEIREGNVGVGVNNTTYMPDVSCYECHMWSTGHGTPAAEAEQGHMMEPRAEACVVCHEVNGTALPVYNVTTAQAKIDELHANFTATHDAVEPNIESMKENKSIIEGTYLWTPEIEDAYYEACWNFGLAAENGGNGNHNPEYSEELMQDANTKALMVLDAVPENFTVMGITPSSDTAYVGSNFTTTIYIDPTAPGAEIGGWQIYEFGFTQSTANAVSVTAGSNWTANFDPGVIDNGDGTITDIQTWRVGPYPDDNHTACTISFTALSPGVCTFEISTVDISNENYSILPKMTYTATVTVLEVPIPPEISDESPGDGATGVDRPPAELSATVEDVNGDEMDIYIKWINHDGVWTVLETYNNVYDGTYDFTIPNENDWIWGNTIYVWSVNATDGSDWTNETYQYTTGGSRYDVNNNGIVNFQDAGLVWAHRAGEAAYDGIYDVNDDSTVDFVDAGLTWTNRD